MSQNDCDNLVSNATRILLIEKHRMTIQRNTGFMGLMLMILSRQTTFRI